MKIVMTSNEMLSHVRTLNTDPASTPLRKTVDGFVFVVDVCGRYDIHIPIEVTK